MRSPEERLAAIERSAALDLVGQSSLIPSHSNDTWTVRSAGHGAAVLRVCWIGDRRRLLREAVVGRALPAEVGYPAVLGSGTVVADGQTITWSLARRLTGCTLRQAWSELTPGQRERALREVARPLAVLHGWRPPGWVIDHLGAPDATADPMAIVGATLTPLPLERVRRLVPPATERAPDHRSVIADAWRWLVHHARLLPRLDDPADAVTHGDLHLDNIWWDGARVHGLLDLEWARFGPPWLDLATVRDNALSGDAFAEPHARLLAIVKADAPELQVADVDRRLTGVQLAHQIRQVLVWPPPGPEPAVDHPVRMLQRLLDAG